LGVEMSLFGFLQVVAKTVIIAAIILVAVVASLRVWRTDLDLRRLFSPKRALESSVEEKLSWLPAREKDALYQNGKIVARIIDATVRESKAEVFFEEIYKSNELSIDSEFEFQKYRLRLRSAETLNMFNSSSPQKGRIITKAVCEIIGERSAL
jgi:hypothetical protein